MRKVSQEQLQRQLARQDKWKHENTTRVNLWFTKLSGIPDAMQKMQEATGKTPTAYAREAITESLKSDGYLKK